MSEEKEFFVDYCTSGYRKRDFSIDFCTSKYKVIQSIPLKEPKGATFTLANGYNEVTLVFSQEQIEDIYSYIIGNTRRGI